MNKIKLYLCTFFICFLLGLNAQNEINIQVLEGVCNDDKGSLSLSLANPGSPTYPLPYTIEVENQVRGTEVYFDMTSSVLNIENLDPSNYLVTIYFNETCKLDIPLTILGNADVIEIAPTQPCGASSGKLVLIYDYNIKQYFAPNTFLA